MKAHISTVLPIKNRVMAADEDTAFLAHYDLNEHDVLRGVNAMGSTTSCKWENTYMKPQGDQYNIGTSLTMSAWVYPTATPGSDRGVLIIGGGAASTYYFTIDGSFKLSAYWYGKNPAGYHTSIGTCPLNTWTHVSVVWNQSHLKMYINGILDKEIAVTGVGNVGTTYLSVGTENGGARLFKGRVRDLGIWSVEKNQSQIKEIMETGVQKHESGLRGFWKMDEGEGSILRDSSPFHADMIPESGKSITWEVGNSVFTMRPQEGRFGGAIAVEEGTTNLATDPLFEQNNSTYWSHRSGTVFSETGGYLQGRCLEVGINNGVTNFIYQAHTIPDGETHTLSVYVKMKDGSKPVESGTNNLRLTLASTYAYGTLKPAPSGWWRAELTVVGPKSGYLGILQYSSNGTNPIVCSNFQVEKKSFPTSFVNGTRSHGNLVYPTNLFNHDEGVINMWVSSIHDLSPMPSGTSVGQGDRPFIFPSLGSDWASDNGVFIWYLNDGHQMNCIFAGKTISGISGLAWPAYEWHMVTLAWSKSNNRINMYLDGVPHGSPQVFPTSWNSQTNYKLGHINSNFLFDELRIDKITRTDEEILAWYESNSPFWPRGIYRKSY